jgi:hypothetical protein
MERFQRSISGSLAIDVGSNRLNPAIAASLAAGPRAVETAIDAKLIANS